MNTEVFVFRLYVTGNAPNSLQAMANLAQLCETHLPGRHEIEIVDVRPATEEELAHGHAHGPEGHGHDH